MMIAEFIKEGCPGKSGEDDGNCIHIRDLPLRVGLGKKGRQNMERPFKKVP